MSEASQVADEVVDAPPAISKEVALARRGRHSMKYRRSWPLYAEVVRLLYDGVTVGQLAERCRLTPNTAHLILRRFHDQGIAHIGDWIQPRARSVMVAFWQFGPGVDAPCPPAKSTGLPTRRHFAPPCRPLAETISFANLIRALAEPHSINSLADITGGTRGQVERFVRIAKQLRIVYVADWERSSSGPPAAMYQLGADQRDKPRPKVKTRAQIHRQYIDGRNAKRGMLTILHALAANRDESHMAAAA